MDRILLFIPMYNCEKQIIRVLDQLTDKICKYFSEVIIVNNRSTDNGEQAVISYLNEHSFSCDIRLLRNDANYGLGGSHKAAFDYAVSHGFDYIVVLHGDDQGNIADLLPYLKKGLYKKYDCLLGARFMKGSRLQGYSKFRTFGNIIYNILFSIGCRKKIYDLGSGLNMYSTDILKNRFYEKYKDNLTFNCYMIIGASYYRQKIRFFPIVWSEKDQLSNVRMANQAITTLKILLAFVLHKKSFMQHEHRDHIIKNYSSKIIYPDHE